LRHLRYFLVLSEELHFGRAAERLHIAQPPLSQAIRKLENELGVKLLNRTSRVVTHTAAGLAFADEARKVLATFERAIAEARRAGGVGHVVRIGCLPFLPIQRLLHFLDAFRRRFPDWQAGVVHMGTLDQLRGLRAGELDVGIFHYAQEHEGFVLERLYPGEPLVAYLAPADPLAEKDVIRPEDVRDSMVVLFAREINPTLHDWFRRQLNEAGYRFRGVIETGARDSIRDQLVSVAAGAGIVIAPFSIKDVSQAGDVVVRRPIDPPLTASDTVLALPAQPSRELAEVVAGLQEIAAELRAGPPP
jgi:DNA-binding transcriptional LysR family regulator